MAELKAKARAARAHRPIAGVSKRTAPGPIKDLIKSYSDALERSRQTGKPVRFIVAIEPEGQSKITTLEPETPDDPDDLDQALAAARERGKSRATEILERADMLSADAFARLIGTSRVTVNAKRQAHQLLGLDGAKRGFRFPEWQVGDDGKPFAALPALFERLGGAWAVYRFLIQHHPELDGLTAREALRQGMSSDVLAVAEGIAQGNFA
jgi:hypothetical protein